jgi:hypothetical protein
MALPPLPKGGSYMIVTGMLAFDAELDIGEGAIVIRDDYNHGASVGNCCHITPATLTRRH